MRGLAGQSVKVWGQLAQHPAILGPRTMSLITVLHQELLDQLIGLAYCAMIGPASTLSPVDITTSSAVLVLL